METFLRAGSRLVSAASVTSIDLARIEALEVTLRADGEEVRATGQDAIDAVMALRPSALEGRRMRWARHAWAIHNLVGHPLLQVLAWLGLPRLGLAVHDATVPRPRGSHRTEE